MKALAKRAASFVAATVLLTTGVVLWWTREEPSDRVGEDPQTSRDPGEASVPGSSAPAFLKTWAPANEGVRHAGRARAIEAAEMFDLLVVSPGVFDRSLPAMRRANPDLTILVYLNAAFVHRRDASAYPGAWFAHDERGTRIRSVGYGNWLMDVSNPGWRLDRADRCAALVSEGTFDGCMLDLLGTAPLIPGYATATPVDPRTGVPWDPASWLASTSEIADTVSRRVHPAIVAGNGLASGPRFSDGVAPTSVLLREIEPAIAESWLRAPRQELDSFPSLGRWSSDVRMIRLIEGSGSRVLVLTKAWVDGTRREKDRFHEFALASFLLATNGRSFFHFSPSPSADPSAGHPWWKIDLGSPREPFQIVGGLYRRRFTKGLVVVNPTSVDRSLDLDGSYFDLRGGIVRSRILAGHTGLVLSAMQT